jgi:predicted component of type VI protein secretion system
MEDWFRWLATIVAGAALAVSGWLLKLANDLDRRVTVLEQRPVVDPYTYIEEVTKLNAQLLALTSAMAENTASRREQYIEMHKNHMDLAKELDEVRSDVKLLLNRVGGGLAR